jgi:hypothetical protein
MSKLGLKLATEDLERAAFLFVDAEDADEYERRRKLLQTAALNFAAALRGDASAEKPKPKR